MFKKGDKVRMLDKIPGMRWGSFGEKNPGRICTIKSLVDQDKSSAYVVLEEDTCGGGTYNHEIELVTNKKEVNIMTTVSNMAKKFVDADTQALIEAGFLSDNLQLTAEGIKARDEIMFDNAQAELVKLAKATIAKSKKEVK